MASASVVDRLVDRRPIHTAGKSGAPLESARLDGRSVIVKHLDGDDLLGRVVGPPSVVAELWELGWFERMPAAVDHAMLAVEPDPHDPHGYLVVQRDVGAWLVDDTRGIAAAHRRRLAAALTSFHLRFEGDPPPEHLLMAFAGRFNLIVPATYEGLPDDAIDGLAGAVRRGWAAVPDAFPPDVVELIDAIMADPDRFVAELHRRAPVTWLHGDAFHANLAFPPHAVTLLDWSQLTIAGPAIYDGVHFLGFSAQLVEGGADAFLDDLRAAHAAAGRPLEEPLIDLASLGVLVEGAWNKALVVTSAPTADERVREQAVIDWWVAAARRARATWSP